MQESPDQQESLKALQPTANRGYCCYPPPLLLKALCVPARPGTRVLVLPLKGTCCKGKGGSSSLASFDFLLKRKKNTTKNHTTFGESAMPSDCSAEQTWKREEIPEETTL